MIPARGCLVIGFAIAVLIMIGSKAKAADLKFDCPTVRAFVAEHGKVKALALAIENGATWKQIVQAKRCLK